MSISLDDFIMSVRNGNEGPNIPSIRRNMRGDQVFELPFKTVCNGYCKKHDIYPLSLYTTMQQGICDDMSRRSERSSLFRNLLDKVKDDWGYGDLYLPDVFAVQNVDFDENHVYNEQEYLNSLLHNFETMDSTISDNDDETDTYDSLLSMKSDVDDCLERNGSHIVSLSTDNKSPYTDVWSDMSTLMKSDYLESLQDSNEDSNVLRYATKKINKEIPDETPQIFTNLNLLEILKLKKIEEYKRTITSIIQQLQQLKDNLDNILQTIPQPTNQPPAKSWLSYLIGDVSDDDNEPDNNESDDEMLNTKIELTEAIHNLDNDQDYQPENLNNDDLNYDNDDNDDNDLNMDGNHNISENNNAEEFVLSFDNKLNKYNFF